VLTAPFRARHKFDECIAIADLRFLRDFGFQFGNPGIDQQQPSGRDQV